MAGQNGGAQAAPKVRMVKTYIDEIEVGTPEFVEEETKKSKAERRKLPPGAESKTLYKDIVRIAWPSLIEMTLASLVSMVDMMMVGKIPGMGSSAITAVSLATQPRFLFMMLFMALNTGATAVIARARGAGDRDEANNILRHAFLLNCLMAIPMMIIGIFTAEPLIKFMGGDGVKNGTITAATVAASKTYLQIQMAGFLPTIIPITITAVLRGTGNSRVPMVYNIVANVVNVFLNWVLIYGNLGAPAMGVAGASLATIIGLCVATVMALFSVLSGKNYLHLSFKKFKLNVRIIGQIIKVGVPALIEQGIMRVGIIIFTRTIGSLGEVNMATHQVCMNIQSLTFMTGQAFAVSSTTLVGQCLGKTRPDMAEHYSRRCRRLGLYVALFLAVTFSIGGGQVVKLYTDASDPTYLQVVMLGALLMLFVAFLQPIQSSQFILAGALRGAGDTRSTAVITLITVLVVRPVFAWFFVSLLGWGDINFVLNPTLENIVMTLAGLHGKAEPGTILVNLGLIGAWISIALDQILRSLLVMARYNSGKWKKIKL